MPRKKRAPWIKLFGDYASSPSHSELDDRALWTGVALMQLIRAGCDARDDRECWALQQSGKPCSVYAIAQQARQPHTIAQRGLNLLVDAGTAERRESDGAYGIPNFWRFQETPDAARKRNKGGKSAPDSAPCSAPPSGVALTREVRGKSVLFENTPVVPTGDQSPNPLVAHVLAEMASAVRELKPNDRGPRDTPANRKLIASVTKAHALTPELWSLAIRRQLANVRPNRANWTYLSLSTLCVPRNMARLLDAPDAEGVPPANTGALLSIAEIRAREAEEDARVTR